MKPLVEELRQLAALQAPSAAVADPAAGRTLVGTERGEKLRGGAGDDIIEGRGGNDKLIGGGGNDTFVFGPGFGRDVIKDAGAGDTLRFEAIDSTDLVYTQRGKHLHIEVAGTSDTVILRNYYKGGHEVRMAFDDGSEVRLDASAGAPGSGAKLRKLGPGDDHFKGGDGPDHVDGGKGDDVLEGDGARWPDPALSQDDILHGGKGDDLLMGGAGNDILSGGPGHDVFLYRVQEFYEQSLEGPDSLVSRTADGADLILDFERGNDMLDLELHYVRPGYERKTSGNFDAFDSNGDGVLDARDEHVSVQEVRHGGRTEASLVLDAGAAFRVDEDAAGYIDNFPYQPGPHTITLFGVTGLDQGDFVPTMVSDNAL